MKARNVNVFYGNNKAIDNVTIDIGSKEVISFIGPSGCGKSTFLRCFNRMNDTIDSCVVQGEITIDDENIYDKKIDVVPLRARIGMVFQNLIHFQNLYTIMLLMAQEYMVCQKTRNIWMLLLKSLKKSRSLARSQ